MNESEKKIRKYIRPNMALTLIGWISLLLTLALVAGGILYIPLQNNTDVVKFDALYSEEEAHCYVDVVAVSDWLYDYSYDKAHSVYYVVEDPEGYLSFATISSKEYAQMTAQQAYWNGETDTAPEPYRLVGWAMPIDANKSAREALYETTGVTSNDEFESYFGTMCLRTDTNPREGTRDEFFVGALVAGLVCLCVLPTVLLRSKHMKKSLRVLRESGTLERATEELEGSPAVDRLVVGSRYFFIKREGIALALTDVKSCSVTSKGVSLDTDTLGRTMVNMKLEATARLMEALPLENSEVTVIQSKSR